MNKKDVETIYPLSPAQEGMLFGTLSSPNSGIYIEQLSCILQGNLNIQFFEKALQILLDRHPILRTVFVWKKQDEPRQVVLRQVPININYQDWRKLEPLVQQKQLADYLKFDRYQGFDLSKPTVIRLALFQLNVNSYQFVWSHHHILMDGWCLPIIFKELLSFYQAITKDEDLYLKPSRPYKDYITWLRQQDWTETETFWRSTLRGFTQPTTLGLTVEANNLPDSFENNYGQQEASLSVSVTTALKFLARQHKITLNTLIQGIWALLLYRYSGNADVVFGITVSGRSAELVGIDSMIGLFINTLPLRIKISSKVDFWSWLQDIYAHNEEIRQYEYSSAGQIHQWSEVPGAIPLYESLLVFQNYPTNYSILQSSDLDISVRQVTSQGAQTQYPLTLMINIDTECKFSLIYDKNRLEHVSINIIIKHLLELLETISADIQNTNLSPATLLKQIPIDQIPCIKPRLKREREELRNAVLSPRTPVEEILVNIWTQILKLEQVGINDNFFELGGHSLLATQVTSRIRKTFNINLSLHRLFESPTIASLAKDIQEAMRKGMKQEAPSIKHSSRNKYLPLSFAQERLWLAEQLHPGSFIYNVPAAVSLFGSLNVAALEQSLGEIVRRHEAIRTNFSQVDGQPFQVITPALPFKLPIVDLQNLPTAKREIKVQQLLTEEFQRTFDLAQDPLLRCTLLRLNENEYLALFTIHHIVSDGWSISVLIRELAALYEAFSVGKPSPLPELPIQYADFAVWQRQWLQGEVLATLLAYWKKQLGNNLPVLQLPTTRPRAEVHNNQSGTSSFVIPPNLSATLQTLSRSEGATLFMTLLAGFQVLLQRYTHQDDIVVGTDVANRNRSETEPLIGFFINLLVLRTDMSGNPSFRDLLKRVREVALGAYAHQDLPFDKLVKALQPERNLSHTPPLFQVLFVLQNTPNTALKLPGLTLNLLEVEHQAARFDLALFLTETDQGIVGNWQYNADLFDAKTLTRMTEHFLTLLNGIVAQPDARINTFKMLTDEEIEQQAVKRDQNKAAKLKRFMTVQPQAINLSQEQLIKTDSLQPGEILPLVTTPNIDNIDIVDWAKNNREFIESKLLHHGAILFRNFDLTNSVAFENFAEAICPGLFGEYGDLPREGISGKVYGSTPYPAEQAILFHNESSHMHCWPQKIWFFCIEAAQKGGETPIVDCRKVFRLLDAKVREKFEQKQLMYVRNFTDSLDVSWQEFFHTTDKAEVEEYCRKAAITCEWKPDGGLRTQQIRPAIIKHPKTGETVFFNQIQLHHSSYLAPDVKESLLSLFGEENLPRHVYYGDGSPIEDSVIAELSAVYQEATVAFPWQQGDVLMLDNMLTAHGRNPYIGSRKIVVAMGEMISNTSV